MTEEMTEDHGGTVDDTTKEEEMVVAVVPFSAGPGLSCAKNSRMTRLEAVMGLVFVAN